jgi:integrase
MIVERDKSVEAFKVRQPNSNVAMSRETGLTPELVEAIAKLAPEAQVVAMQRLGGATTAAPQPTFKPRPYNEKNLEAELAAIEEDVRRYARVNKDLTTYPIRVKREVRRMLVELGEQTGTLDPSAEAVDAWFTRTYGKVSGATWNKAATIFWRYAAYRQRSGLPNGYLKFVKKIQNVRHKSEKAFNADEWSALVRVADGIASGAIDVRGLNAKGARCNGGRQHDITDERFNLWLRVAFDTGARKAEVSRLQWEDFDFETETPVGFPVMFKHTKTADEVTRYIAPKTRDLLLALRQRLRPKGTDWVFPARKPDNPEHQAGAGHVADNVVNGRLKFVAALAGIKRRVHPHMIRKTTVTVLMNRTGNKAAVKEFLHIENDRTIDVYYKPQQKDWMAVIARARGA